MHIYYVGFEYPGGGGEGEGEREKYAGTLVTWNSSLTLDDPGGPGSEAFVEIPGSAGCSQGPGLLPPSSLAIPPGKQGSNPCINTLPGAPICSMVLRTLRPQRANGPPGSDFLGQRDVCALPFKVGSL